MKQNATSSTLQVSSSLLFAAALFFFILTVSIGLPIYFRPFYYWHIEALDLPQRSGYSALQIRQAYDAVLNYLTVPGFPFSTGVMAHSAEGAAHFADCKVLFDLNGAVLLVSGILLTGLSLLKRFGILPAFRIGKKPAALYAALAAIVLPVVLGGLAALDFSAAFVLFHSAFFPGKTNWIFNPVTDPIITVMPEVFFRNCAILIGCSILSLCAATLLLCRCQKANSLSH